jgi:hypothetical protein
MTEVKLIPTQTITIDGKPRTMRLDMGAVALIEQLTGRNLLFGKNMWGELTISDVLHILYATLKHDNPELTEETLGSMLPPSFSIEAMQAILALWQKSMPTPTVGEGKGMDTPPIPFVPPPTSGES